MAADYFEMEVTLDDAETAIKLNDDICDPAKLRWLQNVFEPDVYVKIVTMCQKRNDSNIPLVNN